ncbi:hypothetical protein GGR58DRAFT_154982 [Xylaria digitata]|nr:hypothetical protein GGR58DRAFT_154982 [Xylaria digitata]
MHPPCIPIQRPSTPSVYLINALATLDDVVLEVAVTVDGVLVFLAGFHKRTPREQRVRKSAVVTIAEGHYNTPEKHFIILTLLIQAAGQDENLRARVLDQGAEDLGDRASFLALLPDDPVVGFVLGLKLLPEGHIYRTILGASFIEIGTTIDGSVIGIGTIIDGGVIGIGTLRCSEGRLDSSSQERAGKCNRTHVWLLLDRQTRRSK